MKFYTRPRRQPQVIIVSLIDILAILLIFVIVTTTFKQDQPEVVIKLPESKSAAEAESSKTDSVILSISEKEEIFLDSKRVTMEELRLALKEIAQSGKGLALNADTKAPFGMIIRILDALKDAGIKDVPAFTEFSKQ